MLFTGWMERLWKKELNMKLDKKDLLLYLVTDRAWLGDESLSNQVEKAMLDLGNGSGPLNHMWNID